MTHEAINGGLFVAQNLMALADRLNASTIDELTRLHRLRQLLTPTSRMLYDRPLSLSGVEPIADEETMMRAAASMSAAGMSLDTIRHQLRVRYGMDLSFTRDSG